MELRPEKLTDIITEKGARELLDGYTGFGSGAAVTDDEQQRILSSAMKKAGFEMKSNTIQIQKARKHSKRFVAFAAAAALLAATAIGAGAYYMVSRGTWNGLRSVFDYNSKYNGGEKAPAELDDSQAAAIESVTEHGGALVSNSFEGIDVTFEGAVTDVAADGGMSQSYMIFTLRKTDGTAFEKPQEGWRYVVGYEAGAYQKAGYQPLYPDTMAEAAANDDGSLSVTLSGLTNSVSEALNDNEKDKYPLRASFTDIYLEQDYPEEDVHTELIDKLNRVFEAGDALSAAYIDLFRESSFCKEIVIGDDFSHYEWTDDPVNEDCEFARRCKQAEAELQAAHEAIASKVYRGSVVYDIDCSQLTENALQREAELNGRPVYMRLSPLGITISGTDGDKDPFYEKKPTLTINYLDGSSKVLELQINTSCTVWVEEKQGYDYEWNVTYADSRPIDPGAVASVVFEGVTFDINSEEFISE